MRRGMLNMCFRTNTLLKHNHAFVSRVLLPTASTLLLSPRSQFSTSHPLHQFHIHDHPYMSLWKSELPLIVAKKGLLDCSVFMKTDEEEAEYIAEEEIDKLEKGQFSYCAYPFVAILGNIHMNNGEMEKAFFCFNVALNKCSNENMKREFPLAKITAICDMAASILLHGYDFELYNKTIKIAYIALKRSFVPLRAIESALHAMEAYRYSFDRDLTDDCIKEYRLSVREMMITADESTIDREMLQNDKSWKETGADITNYYYSLLNLTDVLVRDDETEEAGNILFEDIGFVFTQMLQYIAREKYNGNVDLIPQEKMKCYTMKNLVLLRYRTVVGFNEKKNFESSLSSIKSKYKKLLQKKLIGKEPKNGMETVDHQPAEGQVDRSGHRSTITQNSFDFIIKLKGYSAALLLSDLALMHRCGDEKTAYLLEQTSKVLQAMCRENHPAIEQIKWLQSLNENPTNNGSILYNVGMEDSDRKFLSPYLPISLFHQLICVSHIVGSSWPQFEQ